MSTELYLGVVSVTNKEDVPGRVLARYRMENTSAEVLPEPQPQRAAITLSFRVMPLMISSCKGFSLISVII